MHLSRQAQGLLENFLVALSVGSGRVQVDLLLKHPSSILEALRLAKLEEEMTAICKF